MAFHWALSWKCSQLCIFPFYFFNLLFSKKHVFMFGCHWFCHVLCIFWAGWVVVSAAFFVSRGSEHVEYPQNNFTLGGNLMEWHSTGLSPGSVPSLCILPFYFFHLLFSKKHVFMFGCHWFRHVVHFLGWLGGCVSCLFCFQGFRACRIPRE